MRGWIAVSVLGVVAASTGSAWAAPAGTAHAAPARTARAVPATPVRTASRGAVASRIAAEGHAAADREYKAGDYRRALELIDQHLAIAPRYLDLLRLRASVLLAMQDQPAAIAAYQACLAAGVKGSERLIIVGIIKDLRLALPTLIKITLANGPGPIRLDYAQKAACTAAPSCVQVVSPGRHRVVVERAGFERWTGTIDVAKGATTQLSITLIEKPSPLILRIAPQDARVTVDGAPFAGATTLAPGPHRFAVSLAGHRAEEREVVAHEGAPIDLEIALLRIAPVHVVPAIATLRLDGEPVALEAGGIALSPGAHELTARAPGFVEKVVAIRADRDDAFQIAVQLQRPPPPPPPPDWFTIRRKFAVASVAAGLAAAATGVVLGVQSSRRDSEARALCPSEIMGCSDAVAANELNRRARDRAGQANVAYGVAGAAAVAAAILWLTGGPESRPVVSPQLGQAGGAGLAITGSF